MEVAQHFLLVTVTFSKIFNSKGQERVQLNPLLASLSPLSKQLPPTIVTEIRNKVFSLMFLLISTKSSLADFRVFDGLVGLVRKKEILCQKKQKIPLINIQTLISEVLLSANCLN